MTLVFIDGFDHYNKIREKWSASGSLDNPTFEVGRFGEGQVIKKQFQNAQQSIRQVFASQTEVFFGIAFKAPGFPVTFAESQFRLEDSAGTVICNVSLNTNGTLVISAGGQSATTVAPLTNTQFHFIEVHYTAKNAGGIAELKVDEAVVATITGDTTTGLEDDITTFGFMDDGTNSPRYLYDDLYILNGSGSENNDYLGDVRITTFVSKADGNRNEWTPDDILDTNFNSTNEVVMNSNIDYVESGLVGAAEDYDNEDFADRAIAPGQIFGVQVANATLRTATANITFKNEMVIAGVRFSDDVEYTPGNTAYFINTFVRDTDPSDNATWTPDKIAAVGSGLIITSKVTI